MILSVLLKTFSFLGVWSAVGCQTTQKHKLTGRSSLTLQTWRRKTAGRRVGGNYASRRARLASTMEPVVIRVTGPCVPCVPCAPLGSGLDPARGGGPWRAGKTATPGMPCHGRACVRELPRRGAGGYKAESSCLGNRPACGRKEPRAAEGLCGGLRRPGEGEVRGPRGRVGGSDEAPVVSPCRLSPHWRSLDLRPLGFRALLHWIRVKTVSIDLAPATEG